MLGFVLPASLFMKCNEHEFLSACVKGRMLFAELRGVAFLAYDEDDVMEEEDGNLSPENGSTGVLNPRALINTTPNSSSSSTSSSGGIKLGASPHVHRPTPARSRTTTRSKVVILLQLYNTFKKFYLPILLIIFGFIALIIGVTTVLVDSA